MWLCVCECGKKVMVMTQVSVSDYVAQLLADLRQQPAHERKRLMFFELKNLVVRDSKNGSRRWLTLLGSSN